MSHDFCNSKSRISLCFKVQLLAFRLVTNIAIEENASFFFSNSVLVILVTSAFAP